MTKPLYAALFAAMLALNFGASAADQENVVTHLEWSILGDLEAVVAVVKSRSSTVLECAAYLDGNPIGSGGGIIRAGIATVTIDIPKSLQKKPGIIVKCP